MKAYLLVTGDFVKTGGMDRANYALVDYLAHQGETVHLVAHRIEESLKQFPNVIWHHVPKIANSDFLSGFLLDWIGRFWARRITRQGGRVLVNGGNCQWADVNWVHYLHAAYTPEIKVSLLKQLKTKITHRYFLQTEKQAIRSAQLVIANSARTQADLSQHLGITDRCIPVFYGIDSALFHPVTPQQQLELRQRLGWSTDRRVVLFIGALGDRRKGFDTLFEAWQQLCADSHWDADLMVVGRGAELEQWKARSHAANLSDRIQFLGFRQDVPDLLRAADCLVAPTRYEAYGLGVHEALCCGLPAIVSADAGIAYRYPEPLQSLLLQNPNSSQELVTCLQHWRKQSAAYATLVKEMWLPEILDHSWEHMAQDLVSHISAL